VGRFDGKTVIISGAGGGIGRACARLLAAEGAKVAVADIATEPAQETADLIIGEGGVARVYPVDVTSGAAVEEAVSRAESELGPVTLAVGAAGMIRNRPFLELPEDSDATEYDLVLLDQIADRWSVDGDGEQPCMWFEIDRHEVHAMARP